MMDSPISEGLMNAMQIYQNSQQMNIAQQELQQKQKQLEVTKDKDAFHDLTAKLAVTDMPEEYYQAYAPKYNSLAQKYGYGQIPASVFADKGNEGKNFRKALATISEEMQRGMDVQPMIHAVASKYGGVQGMEAGVAKAQEQLDVMKRKSEYGLAPTPSNLPLADSLDLNGNPNIREGTVQPGGNQTPPPLTDYQKWMRDEYIKTGIRQKPQEQTLSQYEGEKAREAGMTFEGIQKLKERTSSAQHVETVYLPIGEDQYQYMSVDKVAGTTKPVLKDGKPVILSEKQVLIAEGKKAQSLINPFENKFMGELGTSEAKRLSGLRQTADDAVKSKQIIAEGLTLVDKGIYSGSAANIKLSFDKWLQQAGINIGGEKAANTEAFAGMMGLQVGKVIKAFGTGTGLSDADREYAQKIAGGEIKLTEQSIRKLLDINDRLATFAISEYNSQSERAKQSLQEKDYFKPVVIPTKKQPPPSGATSATEAQTSSPGLKNIMTELSPKDEDAIREDFGLRVNRYIEEGKSQDDAVAKANEDFGIVQQGGKLYRKKK